MTLIRIVLFLSIVLAAVPAAAADKPSPKELRVLYQKATQAFDDGRYEEARELYLEIWVWQPTYDVGWNLATLEANSGDFLAAAEHATVALSVFPPSRDPEERKRLEAILERVRKELALVTIVAPQGSEVAVGERVLGTAPLSEAVFVEPGGHRFVATLDTRVASQRLQVEKGETATVELAFPEVPNGDPLPNETSATSERRKPHVIPIVAGAGVALVGIGMGVGFTVKANRKANDADELLSDLGGSEGVCSPGTPVRNDCDEIHDLREQEGRARNTATWSFAAAGVAAAATVAYALWPRPKRTTAFQLAPMLNGLQVKGSF